MTRNGKGDQQVEDIYGGSSETLDFFYIAYQSF